MTLKLNFHNIFAKLPEQFYTKMPPEKFGENHFLIHANQQISDLFNINAKNIADKDFALYFSGNLSLKNSEPLAMAYSGHQFGQWAGRLGDGRAILLGQVLDKNNQLQDIQLKGSGKTPYSRFGDGRAVLRSCIREYLCSQAITSLGIASSQALCIVGTNEYVVREEVENGAILTRIATSHIRFGHFEHFYYSGQHENLKILADYVIEQHFSQLKNQPDCYAKMLAEIVKKTAQMIAGWQSVGFCHGVMNTDNMSIIGLTIDYGPFGFLEESDWNFICNHSDAGGRYSYKNQVPIAFWNLNALAHALQPLISLEESAPILQQYHEIFAENYTQIMHKKLGLKIDNKSNANLLSSLLDLMQKNKSDYTLTFRYLAKTFDDDKKWLELFVDKENAANWLKSYHQAIDAQNENHTEFAQKLNKVNPKFILRNWVAELCIREAKNKNYQMIDDVLKILQSPFDEHKNFENLATQAPNEFQNLCVSCSS